jgi:hypothetical protein
MHWPIVSCACLLCMIMSEKTFYGSWLETLISRTSPWIPSSFRSKSFKSVRIPFLWSGSIAVCPVKSAKWVLNDDISRIIGVDSLFPMPLSWLRIPAERRRNGWQRGRETEVNAIVHASPLLLLILCSFRCFCSVCRGNRRLFRKERARHAEQNGVYVAPESSSHQSVNDLLPDNVVNHLDIAAIAMATMATSLIPLMTT